MWVCEANHRDLSARSMYTREQDHERTHARHRRASGDAGAEMLTRERERERVCTVDSVQSGTAFPLTFCLMPGYGLLKLLKRSRSIVQPPREKPRHAPGGPFTNRCEAREEDSAMPKVAAPYIRITHDLWEMPVAQ